MARQRRGAGRVGGRSCEGSAAGSSAAQMLLARPSARSQHNPCEKGGQKKKQNHSSEQQQCLGCCPPAEPPTSHRGRDRNVLFQPGSDCPNPAVGYRGTISQVLCPPQKSENLRTAPSWEKHLGTCGVNTCKTRNQAELQ